VTLDLSARRGELVQEPTRRFEGQLIVDTSAEASETPFQSRWRITGVVKNPLVFEQASCYVEVNANRRLNSHSGDAVSGLVGFRSDSDLGAIAVENVPDTFLMPDVVVAHAALKSRREGSVWFELDDSWQLPIGTHEFRFRVTCSREGGGAPIESTIAAVVNVIGEFAATPRTALLIASDERDAECSVVLRSLRAGVSFVVLAVKCDDTRVNATVLSRATSDEPLTIHFDASSDARRSGASITVVTIQSSDGYVEEVRIPVVVAGTAPNLPGSITGRATAGPRDSKANRGEDATAACY
jgi:hypothetical protein